MMLVIPSDSVVCAMCLLFVVVVMVLVMVQYGCQNVGAGGTRHFGNMYITFAWYKEKTHMYTIIYITITT